ncbi:PEP-CTERM sorting domain-containing protein [Noviherbaspirillum sedimenti]|uniref:PEP-CTERM sorting domain-containing protein n=1 Tax=Noviherbaspirillum sedimenti TaxID=2320865 RepID=A0A3A3FXI1_9BURK|nr:PEP-CTERM sorting domain-containing protein [Noviherbaspirillum sedimenti]RJG00424.1 PEP-CTERM sorting domain-containing protein [Noviherbaspirillum sedimenti]
MKTIKSLLLALPLALLLAAPAMASPLLWTLVGVTFDDGGSASGTFSTDSTTGSLLSYDIVTTSGSAAPGFHFDGVGDSKYADNYFGPNSFVIVNDTPFAFPILAFAFSDALTSGGVNALLVGSFPYGSFQSNNDSSEKRLIVSGNATTETTVPEPAPLALLAISLVGLAFSRRKQSI